MSKLTTTHEIIPVADGTTLIDVFSENSVSIGLSNRTTGSPTSGTWTLRGKIAGEANFQAITGVSVIDFASYASITIDTAALAQIEIVSASVAGTGLTSDMFVAVNRFDYRV